MDLKTAELLKYQGEFIICDKEYTDAERRLSELESAFLCEQAGVLASSLKNNTPCPVCGSLEHPSPAVLPPDAPSEADVSKASKLLKGIRKKREDLAQKCSELSASADACKSSCISSASEYFVNGSMEKTLKGLPELIAGVEADMSALSEEVKNLRAASEKAKKYEENINALIAEITAAKAVLNERLAGKDKLLEQKNAAYEEYKKALAENGFTSEASYLKDLLTENDISRLEREIEDYRRKCDLLSHDIKALEEETKGKERTDILKLTLERDEYSSHLDKQNGEISKLQSRYDCNKNAYASLTTAIKQITEKEGLYSDYKLLSDTANGEIGGKAKVTFEAFAQAAYFTQILHAANRRLKAMSASRYELVRRKSTSSLRSQTGLDLDVLDNYTAKLRDVRSLSGGESFKASLALALGLSDVVQQTSGGIRLDAMFIDEGFGSLDEESLDAAMATLQSIAGTNRIIGIISHVSELNTLIDKKLLVRRGQDGSRIEIII